MLAARFTIRLGLRHDIDEKVLRVVAINRLHLAFDDTLADGSVKPTLTVVRCLQTSE